MPFYLDQKEAEGRRENIIRSYNTLIVFLKLELPHQDKLVVPSKDTKLQLTDESLKKLTPQEIEDIEKYITGAEVSYEAYLDALTKLPAQFITPEQKQLFTALEQPKGEFSTKKIRLHLKPEMKAARNEVRTKMRTAANTWITSGLLDVDRDKNIINELSNVVDSTTISPREVQLHEKALNDVAGLIEARARKVLGDIISGKKKEVEDWLTSDSLSITLEVAEAIKAAEAVAGQTEQQSILREITTLETTHPEKLLIEEKEELQKLRDTIKDPTKLTPQINARVLHLGEIVPPRDLETVKVRNEATLAKVVTQMTTSLKSFEAPPSDDSLRTTSREKIVDGFVSLFGDQLDSATTEKLKAGLAKTMAEAFQASYTDTTSTPNGEGQTFTFRGIDFKLGWVGVQGNIQRGDPHMIIIRLHLEIPGYSLKSYVETDYLRIRKDYQNQFKPDNPIYQSFAGNKLLKPAANLSSFAENPASFRKTQ